ncbi:MAG: peptide chain release factor 1 [Holosporales bacterium]|jgi:peptide chain release factor 1|nr:peptide chain release factor 1 [Holosporales bacterium]
MDNSFREKLISILNRCEVVREQLNNQIDFDPKAFATLSKEFSNLSGISKEITLLFAKEEELKATIDLSENSNDKEIKDMAYDEVLKIRQTIEEIEYKIKILLLPKDIDDDKNAILEVRAGTGGDEAGLFAAALFRMYELYSEFHGWTFEVLDFNESGIGAIKEASASISGKGVFSRLKFESGVHRVQRVPETEASGRIHTSAATVAVLPEAEEVDIQIDEKDLQIDTYRSSGAGGQHVNKTDSAVRITHIPTGTIVAVQDERSQHKNKAKAMKILRAKIYENEKIKQDLSRSTDRKNQVGSGDRSERIRTYNFPQGRVSDHRINLTLYKIDKIMDGTALDEIIDKLIEFDQAEKLKGENI